MVTALAISATAAFLLFTCKDAPGQKAIRKAKEKVKEILNKDEAPKE